MKVKGIIIELNIEEAKKLGEESIEYLGDDKPFLTKFCNMIDMALRPEED